MDRNKLKYIIDVGLALSFLVVFVTGIFKFPGARDFFSFMFEIIPGFYMAKIHDWAGVFMGIFVLFHIILNWTWIKCMTVKIFSRH